MTKQIINVWTTANDHTGDPLRTSFIKINDNFTELYNKDTTQDAEIATKLDSADYTASDVKSKYESVANAYTDAEKTKLAWITSWATANSTDAQLRDRTTHTWTQPASTINDFDTEVSNNTDVAANTTARHTHSNKTILDNTTASFTTADETKLDWIEAGAEVNEVNEAPNDWKQYVRKNLAWNEVDIPDAATWWNITWTISAQTDLQTILDTKVESTDTDIIKTLTKAEYDAIWTKDPETLYVVTDEIISNRNLFIQDTEPTVTEPSLWIDTTWWNIQFNLVTP